MTKSLQLAFVAHFDFNIVQVDIKTFFPHMGMITKIFSQPEGFIPKGKGHLVCKL
jgi:hypothetical protein